MTTYRVRWRGKAGLKERERKKYVFVNRIVPSKSLDVFLKSLMERNGCPCPSEEIRPEELPHPSQIFQVRAIFFPTRDPFGAQFLF
jgi:hypothetical protein